MSKIDEKFINNLNNFSVALENIVELLKEQAKLNPTDVVNKLAENLDAEHIQQISNDLEEVKDRTVYISDNTDKILKEVQAANKGKEAGMFETISNNPFEASVKSKILFNPQPLLFDFDFIENPRSNAISKASSSFKTGLLFLSK